MRHGLLNPPVEAAACRKMIEATRGQLIELERKTLSTIVIPETYHQQMGGILALRRLIADLETIYAREFDV